MSTRSRYCWIVQRTDPSGLTAVDTVFRSEKAADDYCWRRNETDRTAVATLPVPSRTYWKWYKHQLQQT